MAQNATVTADRRSHPRFPLILAVQYVGAESVLDYTENLSENGLFIRTERDFELGERVTLVMSFPQLLEPVEMQVEVVRKRDGVARGAGRRRRPRPRRPHRGSRAARRRSPGRSAPRGAPSRPFACCWWRTTRSSPRCTRPRCAGCRRPTTCRRSASRSRATAGAAFDRLLRAPPVDVLITDVFMPVLSGISLVEKIRAEPALAEMPIVVITSGGDRERERLRRSGSRSSCASR